MVRNHKEAPFHISSLANNGLHLEFDGDPLLKSAGLILIVVVGSLDVGPESQRRAHRSCLAAEIFIKMVGFMSVSSSFLSEGIQLLSMSQ
jgi:hypothetical protein